jgi:F0F1-type ATP synthase membrane subunit a
VGIRNEGISSFVPNRVPLVLVVMLFIIEIFSLSIRPLAILLRIVINLACGHLMLYISGRSVLVLVVLVLEFVVCVVQGYVLIVICYM